MVAAEGLLVDGCIWSFLLIEFVSSVFGAFISTCVFVCLWFKHKFIVSIHGRGIYAVDYIIKQGCKSVSISPSGERDTILAIEGEQCGKEQTSLPRMLG